MICFLRDLLVNHRICLFFELSNVLLFLISAQANHYSAHNTVKIQDLVFIISKILSYILQKGLSKKLD